MVLAVYSVQSESEAAMCRKPSAFTLTLAPRGRAPPCSPNDKLTSIDLVRYRTDEYDGRAHYPPRDDTFSRSRRLMLAAETL